MKNGTVPEEAVVLSRDTQLGIQIGKKENPLCEEIRVIEIPEKRFITYHTHVSAGFIQSIEYINEFIIFNKDTKFELKTPCGKVDTPKPRIRERHMISYKQRVYDKGQYLFLITNSDGKELEKGTFEVI